MKLYKEIQKLPFWIPFGVFFSGCCILLFQLSVPQLNHFMLAFGGVLSAVVALLLYVVRLDINIQPGVFTYRLYPFQVRFREITFADVHEISIRKYSPILEYGGWGIRFGKSGNAVNLKGNMGVQFLFKDGRKLLIGTSQADSIRLAIAEAGFIPRP